MLPIIVKRLDCESRFGETLVGSGSPEPAQNQQQEESEKR
jgi:hypothetical protein